ncbi:MAG: glycosyltransferase family 2 protein [Gemmatimonadaceae bacterium]
MAERVALSVIVTTCDSAPTLARALSAVRSSALRPDSYELIVVDDASEDTSVLVASRYADTVVKLSGRRCGPAYARNRGVEIARGKVVAFVESDVVVRRETLPKMLATLSERPDLGAISASHDETPGATNFVSLYWNLLLRFGEERHGARCAQFAVGCGMIRREVFLSSGMYDEWRFATRCLENAELGERLRGAGHSLLLSPDLKVMHLARWDAAAVCKEVWRRGRLLARSLGYVRMSSAVPSEVVFTLTRSLAPALALVGTLTLAAAFLPSSVAITKWVLLMTAALFVTDLPIHRFNARTRGFAFAVAAAPLHTIAQLVSAIALCTGWALRGILGDQSPDATTQAYAEVGLEIWPPVRRRR